MANGTPDTSGRRVLRILQYLARHQRPVLASAVARDCGLPRSSTYRLLHVMAEERFVTYYPDEGGGGSGWPPTSSAPGYLLSDPLSRQAAGILVPLAAETGAFMAIGVLDGTDVIVSRAHIPEAATDWADFASGPALPRPPDRDGPGLLLGRSRHRPHRALSGPPAVQLDRPGPDHARRADGELRRGQDAGVCGVARSTSRTASRRLRRRSTARPGRVVAALTAGFLGDASVGRPSVDAGSPRCSTAPPSSPLGSAIAHGSGTVTAPCRWVTAAVGIVLTVRFVAVAGRGSQPFRNALLPSRSVSERARIVPGRPRPALALPHPGALLVLSSVGVTRSASASPVDDKREEAQRIASQIEALQQPVLRSRRGVRPGRDRAGEGRRRGRHAQKRVARARGAGRLDAHRHAGLRGAVLHLRRAGRGCRRAPRRADAPAVAAQREQYTELVLGLVRVEDRRAGDGQPGRHAGAAEPRGQAGQEADAAEGVGRQAGPGRRLDQEGPRPPGQGQGPAGDAAWSRSRPGGPSRLPPAPAPAPGRPSSGGRWAAAR